MNVYKPGLKWVNYIHKSPSFIIIIYLYFKIYLAEIVQPNDLRGGDPKSGLTAEQIQHLTQYMTHVSSQIVDTYINTRLERAKLVLEEDEEEDEIDAGFKDWDTFADQLTCIGTLGRLNPQPSLLRIQQLLLERFETFKGYFTSTNSNGKYIYIYTYTSTLTEKG